MLKRCLVVAALVVAVFSGYALGQNKAVPAPSNPSGPVLSGGDLGFQLDAPLSDFPASARVVTGKFVVNVNGQWIEARPAAQHGVVPVR